MNLAAALEHVSDGIVGLDADWRLVYLNSRAELLFGRQRAELLGQVWWEAFSYLAGTPAEEEIRAAVVAGAVRRIRVFHPPRYAWHDVRVVPGTEVLLLVMRDVTDVARARQGEAVRDAVREVIDQAPAAISLLRGPEHRIEVMNRMARRILGDHDLEGRSVRSALPELEGQGFFQLLDRVYETGTPYEARAVPVRFDRTGTGELSEGRFDIVYQPVFDADARVSGVLSLSVEVTELLAERARLERRAAEQEAVLAQLLTGVVIADEQGRITFVNETAERLHGMAALGMGPGEYARACHLLTEGGEPYPDEELPLVRAVLHGEVITGARWRIRRPDGSEVAVVGGARPVVDGEGRRIGGVLTLRADPQAAAAP